MQSKGLTIFSDGSIRLSVYVGGEVGSSDVYISIEDIKKIIEMAIRHAEKESKK